MEYLIIFVMIIIGSIWAFISLKEKDALKSITYTKDKLEWDRVLEKNSFVQEIVNEINSNFTRVIYVYTDHITYIYTDYITYGYEKEVMYSKKNLSNFSDVKECLYLAQNIKRKLKYKNIYEIEPVYEESGGNSNTLIGFTQTYNGDFVANYSDSTRRYIIAYKLVAHVRVQQSNNKRDNALKSWNN